MTTRRKVRRKKVRRKKVRRKGWKTMRQLSIRCRHSRVKTLVAGLRLPD